jgi:multidrug efflux system membrane fusion protein
MGGLVVVTQLRPLSVVFTLSEQYAQAIRAEAQKGVLSVVALGRDNVSRLAEGVLSVIDNQIDSTTGTLRLKATFANESLELWPGQFVNVRLRLEVRKGATVVPAQAVQRGPAGAFAFVVSAEEAVQMRPLQVGRTEDGLALVESGLEPGERVVLDGHYRLQPGSKVRAVEGGGKGASERASEGGRGARWARPRARLREHANDLVRRGRLRRPRGFGGEAPRLSAPQPTHTRARAHGLSPAAWPA